MDRPGNAPFHFAVNVGMEVELTHDYVSSVLTGPL